MLKNFFAPKSIAVIGASHNKKKLGFLVYENIRKYGFKGKLYGVNIKGGKVGAKELYKNVCEIDGEIDLAVIVVPAAAILEVIHDLGRKNVPSAIIISSGFSEIGVQGKKLEEHIKEASQKYGMRVLGPNCLGIIDSWSKMNASFAESMPAKMNISLFSQSGAICTAILDWANKNEIGFSRFISLGNKMDIDENDILHFLSQDEKTDIVLGYLESVNDGIRFMTNARHLSLKKPLIVVKSGRTSEGAKSIASHTGNIAGSDVVLDTALKQSGAIRADSLEDLFDYSKIFAFSPEMKGNRVAVISNAGGPAVMMADYIGKSSLKLAEFSQKTRKVLEEHLPAEASCHNPVDIMGDGRADRYEIALNEVLQDENVDGVLVVLTPQVMTEIEKTAEIIIEAKKYGKPIAVSFIGGEKVEAGKQLLEEKEIPSYDFPERAARSLEVLYEYYDFLKSALKKKRDVQEKEHDQNKVAQIIKPAVEKRLRTITEGDISAFDIFDSYGICTVERAYELDLDGLKHIGGKIGFPVVMKTAVDVLHKTDIGGVVTGIKNESELQKAYFSIRDRVREAKFQENSDKVDIYKQENRGIEIFLGAKKDPNFGPLIIFGIGGIYVEALKDFAYRIAPISHAEALKMTDEIKSAKILHGYRGQPKCDLNKIADSIVGLSRLMLDFPEIKEIDINPLKASDKKCVALDGKIILDLESLPVLELVK